MTSTGNNETYANEEISIENIEFKNNDLPIEENMKMKIHFKNLKCDSSFYCKVEYIVDIALNHIPVLIHQSEPIEFKRSNDQIYTFDLHDLQSLKFYLERDNINTIHWHNISCFHVQLCISQPNTNTTNNQNTSTDTNNRNIIVQIVTSIVKDNEKQTYKMTSYNPFEYM
ncbi:hypothetical protein DLAC_09145 [Tieghemostelium lacteum]|uniref:Uncharacterized protein n=1 Tax=Tieghemostelium lacteum TaxID=361077 RepID=A0A151Z982_TIELA|nr:hypothetical protein DLAC_09145 [Tieghemostelium lacteum]|eukprot:KYQ90520.1 hypothetical protein DLAC_09145 [Tieghemostelium lacteum]